MTADELSQCWGIAIFKAAQWVEALTPAMDAFDVTTPQRAAMFIAQTGHESGRGKWVREIWGPTTAQLGYEGRKDLGNVRPGDGRRYMGRGLIQVTGRANYVAARDKLRERLGAGSVPDFEQSPELLELPRNACYSAAQFWSAHGLNIFADAGDFDGCSDIINRGHKTAAVGDANGYAERLALWVIAKRVLNA